MGKLSEYGSYIYHSNESNNESTKRQVDIKYSLGS